MRRAPGRTVLFLQRTSCVAAIVAAVLAGTPYASAEAHQGSLHTVRWFWIDNATGWSHVRCRALWLDADVAVWAAPGASISGANLHYLVASFESRILPTDLRVFGAPRSLGTVNVLLTRLGGSTLGYFDQDDLLAPHARSVPVYSNHANVLYVLPPSLMPDAHSEADVEEVVAHELQHLINFRIRVIDRHLAPEVDWLDEGLAFFAQMINGYWTPRDVLKVRAAAAQPSWPVSQLDEATRAVPQRARVAYGRAGLFVTYLAGRFGNGLVRAIVSDPFVGMRAVNDALQRRGEGTTAAQAFADWGVAAYLDQPGRYGYGPLRHRLHTALHLASRPVRTYPYDTSSCCSAGSVLQPWSQGYVQFGSSTMGTLTVSVEDQQCSMLAALVLQDSTGLFATRVQWLRIDGRGKEITSARGFGDDYDRALLVMNGVGPDITTGSRPSAGPRVRAWMDHAEQARGTLVDASLRQ